MVNLLKASISAFSRVSGPFSIHSSLAPAVLNHFGTWICVSRAATAVGDTSKSSSDGGALAGLFIWSALAPSPTIALPLECTVGAVSFYSTPLKDGRGRDGGNR